MTSHEPPLPSRGQDDKAATTRTPAAPEGGDSACWLHRICPHCDAVTDEDPPTTCPRCERPVTG